MSVSGTFYGIGVGPGDPELMTLKAQRLIAACPVISYPCNAEGHSLARSIAADAIAARTFPEGRREIPVPLPMSNDRAPAREAYDRAAEAICAELAEGHGVGFLCEGDPFFYGSFMYLFQRIAERHPTRIVPGITSLTACAAALGRPLAARSEVLKVLPATLDADRLEGELKAVESAAIMKVGRHFDKVRGVLGRLGLLDHAALVEAASRPDEQVRPLAQVPEGARPYFSMILVYRGAEGW